MRKFIVAFILALFALAAASPLFAQSLGIEVLGVVKPPCSNGKSILLVRSPAGTISEFLKESGTLVNAPVLKLYHADFVDFVGPGISKEALLAEMLAPTSALNSALPVRSYGSETNVR